MKEVIKRRKNICLYSILLLSLGLLFPACHKEENLVIYTEVLEKNDFGGAILKLSPEEMKDADFEFGDILQVSFNDTVLKIPYFDGFYCRVGDMQLTAYRSSPNIEFTAPFCGLPDALDVRKGTEIAIAMFEKGSAKNIQQTMAMNFSNDFSDYEYDTIRFSNARMVKLGRIAGNRLYRSSSPFDNAYNRADFAALFMRKKGIACALNLSDDDVKMQSMLDDMPEYSRQFYESGNVVCCKLKVNYKSDETNVMMLQGLVKMIEKQGPYLVQCLEGKDRTGYACAILEAICGATYDEIVADYMLSYENYFNYNQYNNPTFYNTVVSIRLNDALMYYCGIDDESLLPTIDLEASIRRFMLENGLTEVEIDQLQHVLCD